MKKNHGFVMWGWKVLRFFESEFGLIGKGYDISWLAIYFGKLLNKLYNSKIILHRQNFLKADIAHYDYVYLYLYTKQLASIEDRLFDHITSKTIVISNTFQFSKHSPYTTIKNIEGKNRIYIYRK